MNKRLTTLPLLLAVLAGTVMAQQAPTKPEALIKARQSAFQVVAWNSGRIKANIDGQYNKDDVIKAANVIAAVASSSVGPLFQPGTDKGKGWHDTAVLPDAFADSYRFGQLSNALGTEAAELAKVAGSTDDLAAVKAQYAKVTRTCKACHDDYRAKD
jgi:cytochrome c556